MLSKSLEQDSSHERTSPALTGGMLGGGAASSLEHIPHGVPPREDREQTGDTHQTAQESLMPRTTGVSVPSDDTEENPTSFFTTSVPLSASSVVKDPPRSWPEGDPARSNYASMHFENTSQEPRPPSSSGQQGDNQPVVPRVVTTLPPVDSSKRSNVAAAASNSAPDTRRESASASPPQFSGDVPGLLKPMRQLSVDSSTQRQQAQSIAGGKGHGLEKENSLGRDSSAFGGGSDFLPTGGAASSVVE
ncbi:unnamed protein product, partial [Amoebophrya sp. A25]|eukprot:GSA25T00017835001.1